MLSDLKVGDAIVLVARVTATDPVAGDTLTYFGPNSQAQGTMTISPAGVFSGQLAAAATATPVQPLPEFSAVSAGDVLANGVTGETMVARSVRVMPDGSYQWSASLQAQVWYPASNWSVIGHVAL